MSTPQEPIQDFSLRAWAMIEDAVREENMTVLEQSPEHPPSLTLDETDIFKEIDGVSALKQSIRRMLTTERYTRVIYDHSYGIDSEDLYGNDSEYVDVEIERRVSEALLEDDRILDVHSFDKMFVDNEFHLSFTVDTIFGALEEVTEFGFNPN